MKTFQSLRALFRPTQHYRDPCRVYALLLLCQSIGGVGGAGVTNLSGLRYRSNITAPTESTVHPAASMTNRLRSLLLCVLSLLLLSDSAVAQPFLDIAFPNLSFARPVDLQHAGDGTDRLFVVEQNAGTVRVFDNDRTAADAPVYLDISDRFNAGGNEEGFLGLAFHPEFESNGFLYVYYSADGPRRSVIERFRVDSLLQSPVDNSTGRVILEVGQPDTNHNGGQIRFGPDGFLYIGLGDGGGGGDPDENGQDPTTLLGSILRIDVDATSGNSDYGIPSDNPFAADTTGRKKEIYAWGMRNPWRFSFDADGNLWVGDVGQGALEEVDIVENGKNYGWNTMEGTRCYDPSTGCDMAGLELPVHEYDRNQGKSITGGFVYRGSRVPQLIGSYIFGDYVSGRIWALPYANSSVGTVQELLDTELGIAAFGEDEAGELYVCTFDGRIYYFTDSTIAVDGEGGVERRPVRVFPNPAREFVAFEFEVGDGEAGTLTVFDLLGRELFVSHFIGQSGESVKANWNFAEDGLRHPSGLYFFRVEGVDELAAGSFVIAR